jgi:hypothetical protein
VSACVSPGAGTHYKHPNQYPLIKQTDWNNQRGRKMKFKEIEDEIQSLPERFFGKVEITFQAGIPTFIRTTKDTKLDPKLNSVGALCKPHPAR